MKNALFLAGFLFAALAVAPGQGRADGPVVVELFTSQGCNTCPPADALLAELAERPGIVALSLHVDYWDYIGWEDPYADAAYTRRQRAYQRRLDNRFIYTPQMVIDGVQDVVGSRRQEVERALDEARARPKLAVVLTEAGITLPQGEVPEGGATVWLALLDERHETPVGAGENRGRTLVNAHVVRSLTQVAEWTGEALTLPLDTPREGRYACAVLVQENGAGRILGAAFMEF